jgi:hypothetical protein
VELPVTDTTVSMIAFCDHRVGSEKIRQLIPVMTDKIFTSLGEAPYFNHLCVIELWHVACAPSIDIFRVKEEQPNEPKKKCSNSSLIVSERRIGGSINFCAKLTQRTFNPRWTDAAGTSGATARTSHTANDSRATRARAAAD